MLLTFGSGSHGCLGHGGNTDVTKPKIVEALLGYSVVGLSCGAAHVMVTTGDSSSFYFKSLSSMLNCFHINTDKRQIVSQHDHFNDYIRIIIVVFTIFFITIVIKPINRNLKYKTSLGLNHTMFFPSCR